MSLTIGLLQCDHVADDLVGSHGDYQNMFSELLHAQDEEIILSAYDLTADQFPSDLHACDGYIITGSQFSAYDDLPWIHEAKSLVRALYDKRIPTIGICFGHQLIAESLGGKVIKADDKGWGVGVHRWKIIHKEDWMGDRTPDDFALRVSHQDQVVSMPEESKLIASSDFCPIGGFQTGDHFLTLQGHPEFSSDYANALMSKRIDRIGQSVVETGLASLTNEVDSERVAAWMIAFIKRQQT